MSRSKLLLYELLGNANCKINHLQNIGHVRLHKMSISSKPRNRSWKAREKMVSFESLEGPRGFCTHRPARPQVFVCVILYGSAVDLRFSSRNLIIK